MPKKRKSEDCNYRIVVEGEVVDYAYTEKEALRIAKKWAKRVKDYAIIEEWRHHSCVFQSGNVYPPRDTTHAEAPHN